MSVLKEFKDFINKGNIVDLAVAVAIGGAFGKIVTALVSDLVMPLVNGVLPHGDWRKWEATPLHFRVGDLLGAVVDFLVVAVVVFLVMVKLVGALQRRRAEEAPATKACPECLETVPAAARRCRACASVLTALALVLLLAGTANAQTAAPAAPVVAAAPPPAVVVAPAPVKPPAPPAVEWKAQIKGGLMVTSGNSDSTNGSAGILASRKEGNNKLAIEGAIAYGDSTVVSPTFVGTDMTMVNGVDRRSVETTNNWFGKGRYDRFFTPNNSAFVAAQAAADKIAGKSFVGGGQLGYSRQLVKSARNILVAELGYDFSYERYVTQPGKTLDPVSIHSARVFAGETLKFSPETGASASAEALFNVNKEDKALAVGTGNLGVDAFHDTRVIGKIGLTTTLRKRLSVGLGFTLRYDQNPAPLPLPSGLPPGAAYVGVPPFAKTTDTLTEATLVYTFL